VTYSLLIGVGTNRFDRHISSLPHEAALKVNKRSPHTNGITQNASCAKMYHNSTMMMRKTAQRKQHISHLSFCCLNIELRVTRA
jgi:hypothetical protein